MRIGLDYDGTIADTNSVKSKWIKDNLNIDIPPWKTDRTSCIPALAEHMSWKEAERTYNGFQNFIYTGDYAKATPEIDGAVEGIEKLALNHNLWIVTSRPANMIRDSLDWLSEMGVLGCFEGWYSSRSEDEEEGRVLSKQEICEKYNLNVIVDDDERHLKKIDLPGLYRVLIKNGSTETNCYDNSKGVYIANNWKDVVKKIESLYEVN